MTGPNNPPPPGGPGRDLDLFGDYADQLATVGCDVVDPLTAWAESVAAAAPPLTDEQYARLAPLFARSTGPERGHLPVGIESPARRDPVEPARASSVATSGGPGPASPVVGAS